MRESFMVKVKIKEILENAGLLNFLGRLYGVRWYIRHLKCVSQAKKRAKGYVDKRYERLRELAGVHEGERCFIVCTGPSLTLEDVETLKGEYTFGLNSITKIFPRTDWRPAYYVIEDLEAYLNLEQELLAAKLENCFASDLLIDMLAPKVDFIAYPFDRQNHSAMRYCPAMKPKLAFSGNAYEIVYGAFTVACSAMQLAVYMGFKKIYLIGCDCDYSGEKKHFIEFKVANTRPILDEEEKMRMTYETAKKYADAHGIKIYNVTRGGKLEVFERVDFDELMGKKETEE